MTVYFYEYIICLFSRNLETFLIKAVKSLYYVGKAIPETDAFWGYSIYLALSPESTYHDTLGLKRYEIATQFGISTYETVKQFVHRDILTRFSQYDAMLSEMFECCDVECEDFCEAVNSLRASLGLEKDHGMAMLVAVLCRKSVAAMIMRGDIEIYAVSMPDPYERRQYSTVAKFGGLPPERLMEICSKAVLEEASTVYRKQFLKFLRDKEKSGLKYAHKQMGKNKLDKKFAIKLVGLGKLDPKLYRSAVENGLFKPRLLRLLSK